MDFAEQLFEWATFEHLFGLVMAGCGVAGLLWSSNKAWLGVYSFFWRESVADIIEVSVKEERDHDGDPAYAPLVYYRYNVGNIEFENMDGQFRIIETRGSKTWAEEVTESYKIRGRVSVYYNPLCHPQSVLEQGCSPVVIVVWFVALGTLLGGLFMLGLIRP